MSNPEAGTSRPAAEPDRAAAARMWADHLAEHAEHRHEEPPSQWFGGSAVLDAAS